MAAAFEIGARVRCIEDTEHPLVGAVAERDDTTPVPAGRRVYGVESDGGEYVYVVEELLVLDQKQGGEGE